MVADRVAMLHRAVDHVRHRLEAAVWVLGETGGVVVRIVGVDLVEEQERIDHAERLLPERAVELHARAVDGRLRRQYA